MNDLMKEIANLQEKYEMLFQGEGTKKTICDLVIPFRDKYSLNDRQALDVAGNKLSMKEMVELLCKDN